MSDDTETIEDVLRSVIKEHGKDLYKKENAARLKSFLSDFAVRFPKERNRLNIAIDEGIQEKLLGIDNGSNDEKHHIAVSCSIRLTEDIGFTEKRAMEAVNILAAGLDWEMPLSPPVTERSEPKLESPAGISLRDFDFISETDFIAGSDWSSVPGDVSEMLSQPEIKTNANIADTDVIEVKAPVTGTVLRLCVGEGAMVSKGQSIIILGSMMMELEIKADYSGKIHFITQIGSKIAFGQTIANIQKGDSNNENFAKQFFSQQFTPNSYKYTTSSNTSDDQHKTHKRRNILIGLATAIICFFIWQKGNINLLAAGSNPVGFYTLESITADGKTQTAEDYKRITKIFKKMGEWKGSDYDLGKLVLNKDGTGKMTIKGESRDISWNDKAIILSEEPYPFILNDNKLTIVGDPSLVFIEKKNLWTVIGHLIVNPKITTNQKSSESQKTTQTKNNNKTKRTTLKAEPGETFSVPKYVHKDLNVHEKKDLKSKSLFTVSKDSLVYVSDKHKDGVVVKIKSSDNHIGWVNGTYLRDFKISSVQIGNHDRNGHWITNPGNTLYASQIEHLGIQFYIDTKKYNHYGNLTFYIKIIAPETFIQDKTLPSGFAAKWSHQLKSGLNEIFTSFYMRDNFYAQHPGKWIIEIWYHDPRNNDPQAFGCIASKSFTLY